MDGSAQTVRDLGEFPLIDRISRGISYRTGGVVTGIGDDTAALRVTPGHLLLATCDVQVEGIHFRVQTTTPELLGRKALAVNLSDIASMAGAPRYALVSLGLPPTTPVAFVDGLYAGLNAEAAEFGVDIVGGNISGSPPEIFIDVTLLGEVEPGRVLHRSGARPGDRLVITGHPGDSAGGLALLLDPSVRCPPEAAEHLKRAHRAPVPRVAAGQAVGETGLAHAMIDVSDGLAGDLGHVAEASGVGAVLWADRIPISPELREAAAALGRDPLDFALHGGEDYELLIAVAPGGEDRVIQAIERAGGVGAAVIGEVVPAERGLSVQLPDGRTLTLRPAGYRHF